MAKTKTALSPIDKFSIAAMQAGLLLMTVATTLGMIELPDHTNNKVVVPNQPAFAMAINGVNSRYAQQPTIIRSEREETAPHYITYSTIQRTPSRTGRR
jgi:hypothetical protein